MAKRQQWKHPNGHGHALSDELAEAHDRLHRAGIAAAGSPVVASDLYWALGTLGQCVTAVNELIERLGTNARRQLRTGTSAAETGPYADAPDTALLSAVLALAKASSDCQPVHAAVADAQIAVSDLVARPV